MSRRVVVVGTGTGLGKTHFGVALLRALAAAGLEVAGLKPVESGVGLGCSDAELLRQAGTFHVKQSPPYALRAPISPHLAAAREGFTIALEPIVSWVRGVEAAWVVVETAGGLLSPLAPGLTNLDLAAALEPAVLLLVASDRLGVLHDVTAALFALRTQRPQLPEPIVVLQTPSEPDASTGANAAELVGLHIARRVTTVPRGAPEEEAVQAAIAGLVQSIIADAPR